VPVTVDDLGRHVEDRGIRLDGAAGATRADVDVVQCDRA
jgi:hypothetical protein